VILFKRVNLANVLEQEFNRLIRSGMMQSYRHFHLGHKQKLRQALYQAETCSP
jgi:hypothetical protein